MLFRALIVSLGYLWLEQIETHALIYLSCFPVYTLINGSVHLSVILIAAAYKAFGIFPKTTFSNFGGYPLTYPITGASTVEQNV